MKSTFALSVILLLSGCQVAPTKSYDAQDIQTKAVKPSELPAVTEQTVILDARPSFEFSLSHLNGSVNLNWEDFSQRTKPFRGLLERDGFSLARRFATYGISPKTPVLVVGRGVRGQGEEGRLAWTLKVLGVQNVRFASIEAFSLPKTANEAPPRKSENLWIPVVDDTLTVDHDLFVQQVLRPSLLTQTAGVAVGAVDSDVADVPGKVIVIDVRPESDYLTKDPKMAKLAPDIGAINIPWTQFFDARGLVNTSMTVKLQQVGIGKDRVIYVIDNQGVRSAGVTLALRELGFTRASNFAGGYMELVGRK